MAGQGGPDDETWKKLGPTGRRIYWALVMVVVLVMAALFLVKLLR